MRISLAAKRQANANHFVEAVEGLRASKKTSERSTPKVLAGVSLCEREAVW
jgi:hypothetical protein